MEFQAYITPIAIIASTIVGISAGYITYNHRKNKDFKQRFYDFETATLVRLTGIETKLDILVNGKSK